MFVSSNKFLEVVVLFQLRWSSDVKEHVSLLRDALKLYVMHHVAT